jgi:transposase
MSSVIFNAVSKTHASADTKYHALYAYYVLGLSKKRIAELFCKAESTIGRWVTQFEEEGVCERHKRVDAVYREFGVEKRSWLLEQYDKNPVMFLDEAKTLFEQRWGRSISCSTVWTILHQGGYSRKVIERRAMNIQATDICRFQSDLSSFPWILQNLVFLDEVSFDNRSMMRRNGYGLKGNRILFRGEFCRKSRVSLLCFLGASGMLDVFQTQETFNRHTFIQCLKEFALKNENVRTYPGKNSIWIMDGARIHTNKLLVDYLKSLGIVVLFLPAYTPFFHPIEFVLK